jgi:hypothetical protein
VEFMVNVEVVQVFVMTGLCALGLCFCSSYNFLYAHKETSTKQITSC